MINNPRLAKKIPEKGNERQKRNGCSQNEIIPKNIPDFMSTRSTLPYLENNRSKSDCRVSYSKFPQKIGLIFAAHKILTCRTKPETNI